MKKISIIGDILCEPSALKSARKKDGSYDFSGMFEYLKPRLEESDFVIANLETPLAGKDAKYTDTFVDFNAPDELAVAVKEAGIDVVSTINNHTLDREYDGMIRTLKVLDEIGLDHTGNFLPEKGREEAYYFNLGDAKIALIAYTYSTNHKLQEGDENEKYINYLRNSRMATYTPEIQKKMNSWVEKVFKGIKEENQAIIRKLVGLPAVVIRGDEVMEMDKITPYIDNMKSDIKKAKEKADYVIFYPHVGGQFNLEPGAFSKYVMEEASKAGADIILAAHSHIVQRAEYINGVFSAYSISNVTMCPNSPIVIKKLLPDYGIMMHLYFENKELIKKTFSIIVGVEKKGKLIQSIPVDILYANAKTKKQKEKIEKNVKYIYNVFTTKRLEGQLIRKEYDL